MAPGRGAGRRGDFLTSPEVGPLFGAVVARALDAEWSRLGRPDPFVVVEAGAGRGALAHSVLAAAPGCAAALRYVGVERSARLRAEMEAHLPVEPPATALGLAAAGATEGGGVDDDHVVVAGTGPSVTVLDDLPATTVTGVVLANELLDNLALRLFERVEQGWAEVFVGLSDGDDPGPGGGDGLVEVLVEASAQATALAQRLAPSAPIGGRIPFQEVAGRWLADALGVLGAGRLVVIDYADTTASLAKRPWRDWVRTYRTHGRGSSPVDDPGDQDLTCEVAVDQLASVRTPDANRSQSEWLGAHGLEDLVAAARATWHERAAIGDLAALAARSRVGEAAALSDPAGLGAFRVLEWVVDRSTPSGSVPTNPIPPPSGSRKGGIITPSGDQNLQRKGETTGRALPGPGPGPGRRR